VSLNEGRKRVVNYKGGLGKEAETFFFQTEICLFSGLKEVLTAARKTGTFVILSGPIHDEKFFQDCFREFSAKQTTGVIIDSSSKKKATAAFDLSPAQSILKETGQLKMPKSRRRSTSILEVLTNSESLPRDFTWTKGNKKAPNSLALAMVAAIKRNSLLSSPRA